MKMIQVKSALSKWLLTAVMLLGFFTFSGLIIQVPNRFDKPHTTLVAGYANRISKSISYNTTLKVVNRNALSALISGACSMPALSFLHSRFAQAVIKQASTLYITTRQLKYLFFIKACSYSSADDSYLSIG